MKLEGMIKYLKEALEYSTASDIYELPREEFSPYVNRCKDYIPRPAIPYAVLILLIEEQNSMIYKMKKFLRIVK